MAEKESFLGDNIRRIRMDHEMDQIEVAEKAAISRAAYQKIERGESIPKVSTLLQIAGALGVELTDLVRETPRLGHVRFRSDKKLKGREQILFRVSRWLSDFNQIQGILGDHREYVFRELTEELRKSSSTEAQKAKEAA